MAKTQEVTAKVPAKDDKPELSATVKINVPETLEEAGKMFSPDAVLSNALANWIITLQSNIRAALKRGEDAATIQGRLAGAKMGVAQAGVKIDPVQAYLAKFASSTPAEQAKMLQELQARAAKK